MLELLLCSLLTIFPDYLYRRYRPGQAHRQGDHALLRLVRAAVGHHRLPDAHRRADHGDLLQSSVDHQRHAVLPHRPDPSGDERARRRGLCRLHRRGQTGRADLQAGQLGAGGGGGDRPAQDRRDRCGAGRRADRCPGRRGQIQEARSAHQQAVDELETKQELYRRNPGTVAVRDIEKLEVAVQGRQGAIDGATAAKQTVEARISTLLPAQKASAEAALAQAEVDLAKTVVRAGVSGRVEQFALRVGDIVNPFMRPAGVLIPEGAGRGRLQAGFGQIEAQVMKVGMVAEVTCVSKPWTVIPMVVTDVQDFIAAGQFRGGEQLIDAQQVVRPGTILVYLEPLYEGGLDGVTPGSSCIANAYTSNHDLIASGNAAPSRASCFTRWMRSGSCTP